MKTFKDIPKDIILHEIIPRWRCQNIFETLKKKLIYIEIQNNLIYCLSGLSGRVLFKININYFKSYINHKKINTHYTNIIDGINELINLKYFNNNKINLRKVMRCVENEQYEDLYNITLDLNHYYYFINHDIEQLYYTTNINKLKLAKYLNKWRKKTSKKHIAIIRKNLYLNYIY